MGEFNKQKYDNEYAKNNYDRCIFNVPKGYKAEIIKFYKEAGYSSMNNYVTTLIQNDMNIAHKEMNKLESDESYIVNCYRYASEEDKRNLDNLQVKLRVNFTYHRWRNKNISSIRINRIQSILN